LGNKHRPAARAFLALAAVVPFLGCDRSRPGSEVTLAVTEPKDETGNMHYAERVVIRAGRGRAVVIKTDMEKGVLAPLIEKQVGAGPKRTLLLGWTSWGGGMLTIHALLVERSDAGVVLRDRLAIRTGRRSAGVFLVTGKTGPRIGLPEPRKDVHSPSDWKISFGAKTLDLKAIRALPYAAARNPVPGTLYYCPPFHGRRIPPKSRIVWFTVEKGKFLPPPRRHRK